MKRLTAMVMVLTLLVTMLTACSGEKPSEGETTATTTTTTTTTTTQSQQSRATGTKFTFGSASAATTTTTAMQDASQSVFTDDVLAPSLLPYKKQAVIDRNVGTLDPNKNSAATKLGAVVSNEVTKNQIADFEKNIAYQERNGGGVDKMVHVATFTILNEMVYMTYYANTGSDAEDPRYQEARLAYCPLNDPSKMTILTVQKVGDMVEDQSITMVYDTILMHKDNRELYIMWTASTQIQYYRFYRVFNVQTKQLGPVKVNRFKAGSVTNDFSVSGIRNALSAIDVHTYPLSSDIGVMQKLSTRVENGVTYYYTGTYAGAFNAIIKSKDLITWEYVSTPSFDNKSEFENAVYVVGDKAYYFVRQSADQGYGFLATYDLVKQRWERPLLIKDAQSRSDFIFYNNNLYLIHAPKNRNGFGVVRIDTSNIAKSKAVMVADMNGSCFYPYAKVIGNDVYFAYTVDRKHIRLSKFSAAYLEQ